VLDQILHSVYEHASADTGGQVASYIPELAKVDGGAFGIALVTISGRVYEAGDADAMFTIQSMSKPFTFALALNACGPERVFERVGAEPSGDEFNAVTLDGEGKPFNPMVNAGAVAVAGLLHETHGADAFEFIREKFSELAGADLDVDEAVYESEMETAHRNRAMAHLMKLNDVIRGDVEEVIDVYTKQCSLRVNAKQLAMMAATLANIGINPTTEVPVVDSLSVRHTLSTMFACGMYNYAGRWAVDVGMPAKSGVSGGVFAVVNRQLGIASYSPRLDGRGNSVRGIEACVRLAEELGLHAFEFSNAGSSMLEIYLRE
jgi:glutaminase